MEGGVTRKLRGGFLESRFSGVQSLKRIFDVEGVFEVWSKPSGELTSVLNPERRSGILCRFPHPTVRTLLLWHVFWGGTIIWVRPRGRPKLLPSTIQHLTVPSPVVPPLGVHLTSWTSTGSRLSVSLWLRGSRASGGSLLKTGIGLTRTFTQEEVGSEVYSYVGRSVTLKSETLGLVSWVESVRIWRLDIFDVLLFTHNKVRWYKSIDCVRLDLNLALIR